MKKRTMKQSAVVTKADLARELGCGSGSLSRVPDLPVRPDGKLHRSKVLGFLARQTSGFGGGWMDGGTRGPGLAERAAALLDGRRKEPKARAARTETWTYDEYGHWLMDQIRADLLTVAPVAFRLLAAELMALGEASPDVAALLACDAIDAILSRAVDRLVPEYEWNPMPGYNYDVGGQADKILTKLQEVIDPLFDTAASAA